MIKFWKCPKCNDVTTTKPLFSVCDYCDVEFEEIELYRGQGNENFKKFIKLTNEQKLVLLKCLDYNVDSEEFIVDNKGKKVICPYSKKPIKFKDASILPGSTIIINTSLITLSEYISDHLEEK